MCNWRAPLFLLGKLWFFFLLLILFSFAYIRRGFKEIKEINKESSKLLFPKDLVLSSCQKLCQVSPEEKRNRRGGKKGEKKSPEKNNNNNNKFQSNEK
jgi:hypothetical protein